METAATTVSEIDWAQLSADVEESVDEAYTRVADQFAYLQEKIHRNGFCHNVCDHLYHQLLEKGYPLVLEVRYPPGMRWHQYLVVMIGAEEIIIDPTWQQFLDKRTDDSLPRTLIIRADDFEEAAKTYRIPSQHWHLWLPQEERYIRDFEKAPTIEDNLRVLRIDGS